MFGFKTHKEKRRAKIMAYVSEAADLYCRLSDFAYTVRHDPEHQAQIVERQAKAEASLRHYCRLMSEYEAGLDVELPGEGGW